MIRLRQCFDTKVELSILESVNLTRINCYERRYVVHLTPEEEVRQSALIYFHNHSEVDMNKFLVKVEYQSMDLVLYQKIPIPDFRPTQTPVIIFEFKRDSTIISKYYHQIVEYMKRFNCSTGVLTNSKDIIVVKQDNNNYISKNCNISELNIVIQSIQTKMEMEINNDVRDFLLAQKGDFNAFVNLSEKYGKTSKFLISYKECSAPIHCFYINVHDEFVFFDICGIYTKKKQHKFHKTSFLSLNKIFE